MRLVGDELVLLLLLALHGLIFTETLISYVGWLALRCTTVHAVMFASSSEGDRHGAKDEDDSAEAEQMCAMSKRNPRNGLRRILFPVLYVVPRWLNADGSIWLRYVRTARLCGSRADNTDLVSVGLTEIREVHPENCPSVACTLGYVKRRPVESCARAREANCVCPVRYARTPFSFQPVRRSERDQIYSLAPP